MSKPGDFFVAVVAAVLSVLTLINAVWPAGIWVKTPTVLRLQQAIGEKLARVVLIALAILLMTIAIRLVFSA